MGKDQIKITSGSHDELSSAVLVGDEKYLVLTERVGPRRLNLTTHVYLKGKIISKVSTYHGNIAAEKDFEGKIDALLRGQHQSVIDTLASRKKDEEKKGEAVVLYVEEEVTPADYLKTVKTLLMRKNQKGALELLKEAVRQYPEEPFILSYLGCLEAVVGKKHRAGIDICKKAMVLLKKNVPFGEEFLYPVFYLNLGRAYLAAGRKKDAIEAFRKGLKTDVGNSDLIMELRMLGARKKPVVPFLHRSNPINKYIGMILHKMSK